MVKVELAGIVNGFKLSCVSQLGFGRYCVTRLKPQPFNPPRGSLCGWREGSRPRHRHTSGGRRSQAQYCFPLQVHDGHEDSEEGFGDLRL